MPIKFVFLIYKFIHKNLEFVTHNKKVMISANIKQFRQFDRVVQHNIINWENFK